MLRHDLNDFPPPPPGKRGFPWELPLSFPMLPEAHDLPRISIVTPSFQQGDFLEETIRSVLLQGYPNLEYFVIDGGSTDGSVAILEKYAPWLTGWVSEPDRGQAHAINKGLARATGQVAAYLNSDDTYLPGTLLYVGQLDRDTGFDILVGQRAGRTPHSNVPGRFRNVHLHPYVYPFIFELNARYDLPQESIFWNRLRVHELEFDESYHFCLDVSWFIQIYSGAKVVHTTRELGTFRTHPASKTNRLPELASTEIKRLVQSVEQYMPHVTEAMKRQIIWTYRQASLRALLHQAWEPSRDLTFSYRHPIYFPTTEKPSIRNRNALPRITLVTPSRNQGAFLETTIQSVLAQAYPNLEYMIMDGGSTDNSLEIIHKYESQLAYWTSARDAGQSDALNRAFARATGDIFGWLNSDDVLMPSALQTVADYFAAHPECDFLTGDSVFVDETDTHELFQVQATEYTFADLLHYYEDKYLPQPSVFISRAAWEHIGGLDNALHYGMDLDLWLRLRRLYPLHHIPQVLSRIRIHPAAKGEQVGKPGLREVERVTRRYWNRVGYGERARIWLGMRRIQARAACRYGLARAMQADVRAGWTALFEALGRFPPIVLVEPTAQRLLVRLVLSPSAYQRWRRAP
ncbi:MAG TPA: glycosyltransferase family 2 protein [Anaerolineae bacterium]|nr:glycosyltransferase family 2 protein [Anaerolineae bacterium]